LAASFAVYNFADFERTHAVAENRLLIIDDDARLAEMLVEYLAPEGIELTGSESVPPGPESQPGDPGTQVFRFRSREPGEKRVEFVLGRPWESEVVDRHQVTVTTG